MKFPLVEINEDQRKKLTVLLSSYGLTTTLEEYRFVKTLLDTARDYRDFYKPNSECLKKVDNILKGKKKHAHIKQISQ